jgi:uncharacterized protein YbjT (DUF2867 family)
MIVVTGATGRLGSRVVQHLLNRTAAFNIVACVREPGQATDLLDKGVAVRKGDYDDPEGLAKAFDGADQLLLVSASGIAFQTRVNKHRSAIHAAKVAGVGQVFYTSLLPGNDSVAYVQRAHIVTERSLRDSGLPHTILRNGAYAEAWDLYLGDVSNGVAFIPKDGPVSWVSRDDLGEGIAELLWRGKAGGETIELTGPEALTLEQTGSIVCRAQGQPTVVRIVPFAEYSAKQVAAGKSRTQAQQWATTFDGLARGEFGKVSPTLGSILGREPKRFEEVILASHANRTSAPG